MVFQDKNKENLVIIDGSSYLYRAYYALPNLKTSNGMHSGAIHGFANMLNRIIDEYNPKYMLMVFDAKGKNFRHEIYKKYKATRNAMPKELSEQTEPIIDMVKAYGITVIQESGVEADDVIATAVKSHTIENVQTVISSGDKDLAQLVQNDVVLVNSFDSKVLDTQGVIDKFGVRPDQILDYLCLVGDSSDNIPGVPKVGPKTARTLLGKYNSVENIIDNTQELKGKLRENLENSHDTIDLAKKLIVLKDDLRLPLKQKDLEIKTIDTKVLKKIINKYELKSLSKKLDIKVENKTIKKKYNIVKTLSQAETIIKDCIKHKTFAFDTETTSLDFNEAELVGFSISYRENEAYYFPIAHNTFENNLPKEKVIDILKNLFKEKSLTIIGQNIKYDINILKKYSIVFETKLEDTMLMSYVLNSSGKHDLETLSVKFLSHTPISYEDVVGKGKDQISFADVDLENASKYACEDADLTFLLFKELSAELARDDKLDNVYQSIEIKLMRILTEMEFIGVSVDQDKLKTQSKELSKRINAIEKKIYKISGKEFNISSPKQLQEIFYDDLKLPILKKTPKGQPSTNEDVMIQLAEEHELPNLILSFRNLLKLKNTYTDKLGVQVNSISNRLHTSYNQTITLTGRLSSSNPNLQNIPIRTEDGKKIRSAFIPRRGSLLFSADYSQIELRIMAHLSDDQEMIKSFTSGEDIHSSTAMKVFNTKGAPTPDQRRAAKAINFGLIYGISAYGLARQLKIDNIEAKNIIDTYFTKYKRVREYMNELKDSAKGSEYVETMYGRKVFIPNINHSNFQVRSAAERTAINAPIQGTAADILKIAMININEWLTENNNQDTFMIMQVHDELVFEIGESKIKENERNIVKIMSEAASLRVPLLVNTFTGNSWCET